MKKVVIMLMAVLVMGLSACSLGEERYESMEKVEEKKSVECVFSVLGESEEVYVSYEKVLNENETLYYAPKAVRFNEYIYMNGTSGYIILRNDVQWFEDNCVIATEEQLDKIFK